MRLAIYAPNLGLTLPDQPFGKDVANLGLFNAFATFGGFEHISFCTRDMPTQEQLQGAFGSVPGSTTLSIEPLGQTNSALQAGTFFRGQPYLSDLSWERAYRHSHDAYSLVGLIHTLAPPKVRELIGDVLVAPVQPWDALICTSPAVRECLVGLFDRWQDYISHRFGAVHLTRPHLPVLPLGVDQAKLQDYRSDHASRTFLRRHLRLNEHDVLLLWLGRLSFFEKAYPQAMFIALQKASQRCGSRLHFAMAGWFPGGDNDLRRYQEAARYYAPDVSIHFLDGKNPDVVRCCWAAADIFFSLIDNPQETFGLTPVEAMAAGVPVIVSDWDGYRYTVTDGLEGFRIPTLAPSRSPQGVDLSFRHDHGLLSYQDYVGAVAQHVAVDIEAAAFAIARLADNPSLRLSMGDAGRKTVKQRFDWPLVAQQHHQLYSELSELRCSGSGSSGLEVQHPLRADPFYDFASFATKCLQPDTKLQLSLPLHQLELRLENLTSLDCCYQELHAAPVDIRRLLLLLHNENPCSFNQLLTAWPPEQHDTLQLSITWLAKLGFINWS